MTADERAALLPTLAVSFIVGLLLAEVWDAPLGAVGLLAVGAALLVALSRSARISLLPALALVAVLLGLLRAGLVEPPGADLLPYHDESGAVVQGLVVDQPKDHGGAHSFRLSVDRIRTGRDSTWVDVSGDVRVTARPTVALTEVRSPPYYRYGDRLEVRGRLESPEPIEDFDYPAYLETQGIRSVSSFPEVALISEGDGSPFRRWLSAARLSLADSTERAVAEPAGAFGQAVLLGMRAGLPDSLVEDFRGTGASHLLAISGLHVGMALVMAGSLGALAFGRRRGLYLLLPLVAIWSYALLSGASPSAVRATAMGTVYLLAIAVGRPRSLIPALALAALVMTAIDPAILFSISFQLSFAAMLGISVYVERVHDRLALQPGVSGLRSAAVGAVGVSFAATLATAPLVALHFGQLPLVGLPTTLLVLPAVPFALAFHAVAAVVGLMSDGVAQPFGWLAWLFSSYVIGIVSAFARVPAATVSLGEGGAALVWTYYVALGALTLALTGYLPWRLRGPESHTAIELVRRVSLPWQVTAVAVGAACLVWFAALSQPTGKLRVVFADVGQGDMTVITTPAGHSIVVDGGPDPLRAADVLGAELPFWDRSVDLIVLTHPHSDHLNGLNEILRRYEVGRVLERRQEFEAPEHTEWADLVEAEGAETTAAVSGLKLSLADGVTIEVLGPPPSLLLGTDSDVDNGSVVVRVGYGDRSFILTGDVFSEGEAWLVASGQRLDGDVLRVAHHGSRTSSSQLFLDAVDPVAAVISAGSDNRFGHPNAEVVERLNEVVDESQLFTTAESGSVTFETDGSRLWVSKEQ